MRTNSQDRPNRAFTLVEMVGVLAVISILASMLVPKIFSAINDARLGSTVGSIDGLKSATVSYYSKYGTLPITNSFDGMLVSSEFLERPFDCKIGVGDLVQGVAGPAGPTGAGYKLDGTVGLTSNAATVVQCLISNVAIADAWELSKRVDGDSLSAANASSADDKGRVAYSFTSGSGVVYVYIGHR